MSIIVGIISERSTTPFCKVVPKVLGFSIVKWGFFRDGKFGRLLVGASALP